MNLVVAQHLCAETLFFAQQAKQEVFRPNVFVQQPFGFLRRIGKHAFTFVAEGQVNRGVDFLTDGRVLFDCFPDGFHRSRWAEEAVGEGLILPEQS